MKDAAFITGGCGYIGRNVVRNYLLGNYKQVVILEREGCDTSWIDDGRIEVVYGDIVDPDSYSIPPNSDVFHFAALGGARRSSYAVFNKINVEGTRHLLDAAIAAGAEKFFFMSSISAVGPNGSLLDEKSDYNPVSIYGETKMEAEKYIIEAGRGKITSIIFRPPLIYGPHPHQDSGIFKILKLLDKKIYPVMGSGKNKLPMCSIYNLIHGLETCMKLENREENIFFISDGVERSFNHVVSRLREISGSKSRVLHAPRPLISAVAYFSRAVSNGLKKNFGLPFDTYLGATSDDLLFSIEKLKGLGYSPVDGFDGFSEILESIK
jgi:UDP-glucose 4-epimerase